MPPHVDVNCGTATVAVIVGVLLVPAVVGSIAVADAGQTPAAFDPDAADAPLSSNKTHWDGQTLWLTVPHADAGEIFQIRRVSEGTVGPLATEFVVDERRSAVIDTARFEAGEYVVVAQNQTPLRVDPDGRALGTASAAAASWELAVQSLDVALADTTVQTGSTVEFGLDSNRGRYPLLVSSTSLDPSVVADTFGGELVDLTGDGDPDAVRLTATAFDTLEVDVGPNVSAGTHSLIFSVQDTAARSTVSVDIEQGHVENAQFEASVVQADRGSVASIPIDLRNATSATVEIESEENDYRATVVVSDAAEVGTVAVELNTYLAGRVDDERRAYDATGATIEAVTRHSPRRDAPLGADDYDLRISVGGARTDSGLLALTQRSTERLGVATAPGEFSLEESVESASAVDEIAIGDKLIVEVAATGLGGFLGEEYDLTPNSEDAAAHGAFLRVEPTDGDGDPLNLSSAEVVLDPDGDGFTAVIDTEGTPLEPGRDYETAFVIDERSPYVTDGERDVVVGTVAVVHRRVTVDGLEDGELDASVPPGGVLELTGETTVAPGTELLVTVRSDDTSFFADTTARVAGDRTWRAPISEEGTSEIGNFSLRVRDQAGGANTVVPGFMVVEEVAEATETAEDDTSGDDAGDGAGRRALVVMVGVLAVTGAFLWFVRRS